MNIFEGLEKFGLDGQDVGDLFADNSKPKHAAEHDRHTEVKEPEEKDFLFTKTVRCVVCDQLFSARVVRASKARRLEPDKDLRPRFQYIDTLKYDILSCPHCGYTGMERYFTHLSPVQIKLIREGVCARFKSKGEVVPDTYDYDTALDRYKLSLFNTIVKKGANSERAYTCLKMAWLCRGKAEMLDESDEANAEALKKCREEEMAYYEQAYEGMMKAIETETIPICGMDQDTLDLLMAEMAFKLEKYDVASKILGHLFSSKTANRNTMNRGVDLRQEIVDLIRSRQTR